MTLSKMWGDAKYRDFNDALTSKGTHQDRFPINILRFFYDSQSMSHRLRIIVHDLPIMSVCVESIDRYFAEEHPQGQEIAIDNEIVFEFPYVRK